MARRCIILITLLCSVLLFTSGSAQTTGSVELGIDAGVEYLKYENSSSLTTFLIPIDNFRMGYFVTDAIAVEPSISFAHFNPESGSGFTTLDLGLEFGYNLPMSDEGGSLFFIQAGPKISYINADASDTQFGLGGGAGVKIPVAEKLKTRLQVGGIYYFESDKRVSGWAINFGLGISFFTK